MATIRSGNKQPGNDPALKSEVKDAAAEAKQSANEGNVVTVKETTNQPAEDLPTGMRRSHPPE